MIFNSLLKTDHSFPILKIHLWWGIAGKVHLFPKDHGTALQQTAGDIQNGFRGAEDPGAQDPNLTFETQTLCGQPVLYVKHKQPVQKVCIYVVGDDLGGCRF